MHLSESILKALPAEERDRPFRLLAEGPRVIEKLTGIRPDKTVVWRQAVKGVAGRKLRTISVGRTLMTTPRWLVEFWADVDAARRASGPKTKARRGKGRRASKGGVK